jgi:hypothetical protein
MRLGLDTGFAMQQYVAHSQNDEIAAFYRQPGMFPIPKEPERSGTVDSGPGSPPDKAFSEYLGTGLLEYVHLSNLKPYPNGILQNTHTTLNQGIISSEVYQKIIGVCKDSNISGCLYILNNEDPIAALRDSVKELKWK